MTELKTKPNNASVQDFLQNISNKEQRQDAALLLKLIKKATKEKPIMWGKAIVGFGSYHYKYASGREGDWFLVGFSPRKGTMTVYIMPGFTRYGSLMKKLGRHATGSSCLYLKNLSGINLTSLEQLITKSVAYMRKMYK